MANKSNGGNEMPNKKSEAAPAKAVDAAAKTAVKPAATKDKKTVAKKTTKKAATKRFAPKETVTLQFAGLEFDFAKITKAVESDCRKKFKGTAKTLAIYVKPEDRAVYYVVNGEEDPSYKIEL